MAIELALLIMPTVSLHFISNFACSSTRHQPQFTYCKIENLESLKDLLKSQNISLDTEKAISGQLGHIGNKDIHDLKTMEKA
jgi:hypothetical protein